MSMYGFLQGRIPLVYAYQIPELEELTVEPVIVPIHDNSYFIILDDVEEKAYVWKGSKITQKMKGLAKELLQKKGIVRYKIIEVKHGREPEIFFGLLNQCIKQVNGILHSTEVKHFNTKLKLFLQIYNHHFHAKQGIIKDTAKYQVKKLYSLICEIFTDIKIDSEIEYSWLYEKMKAFMRVGDVNMVNSFCHYLYCRGYEMDVQTECETGYVSDSKKDIIIAKYVQKVAEEVIRPNLLDDEQLLYADMGISIFDKWPSVRTGPIIVTNRRLILIGKYPERPKELQELFRYVLYTVDERNYERNFGMDFLMISRISSLRTSYISYDKSKEKQISFNVKCHHVSETRIPIPIHPGAILKHTWSKHKRGDLKIRVIPVAVGPIGENSSSTSNNQQLTTLLQKVLQAYKSIDKENRSGLVYNIPCSKCGVKNEYILHKPNYLFHCYNCGFGARVKRSE